MQQAVQQHGAAPCGQHNPVAAQSRRIRRVMFQKARPQHVSHECGVQLKTGRTAASLLDGIDRKKARGAHAELV